MNTVYENLSKISRTNLDKLFEENFSEEKETVSEKLLANASLRSVRMEEQIAMMGEEITHIIFLVHGTLWAREDFKTGDKLYFNRFRSPEIFGEMELLAGQNTYAATLMAESRCEFVQIPVEDYKTYLLENPEFLYHRCHLILKRVLKEQAKSRMHMVMNATDRIKALLVYYYEEAYGDTVKELRITRQQLADETGFAVKTINRSIKQLEDDGYLEIIGHRMRISDDQIQAMNKSIEDYRN